MIRALISDFGGVLTTPLSAGFLAYQEEAAITLEDLGKGMQATADAYGDHPLYALERGEISEQEFARRLAEQLHDGFDLARLRHLYFERIEPNAPMIRFVGDLRERGLRTALLTNNVREWEPLWRAKLPELDAIFEEVVDSAFVGMRKPEPEFIARLELELGDGRRIGGMGEAFLAGLERNHEMIDLVADLRGRGLRTALLTNNVREWEPRWRSMLPEIDEIFEVVVDSAFVGMRKPEPEIYHLTVERLGGGLTAEDCVFVDDMAINCDAARDLGMVAVRFETTDQARADIEAALAR